MLKIILKRLLITFGTGALIMYLVHKKILPMEQPTDAMIYFTRQIVPEESLLEPLYNSLRISYHMEQVNTLTQIIHTLPQTENTIPTLMKFKLRFVDHLSELLRLDNDMEPSQRKVVQGNADFFTAEFEKRLRNTLDVSNEATYKKTKIVGAVVGVLATVGFGISFYFSPVGTTTSLFSSFKNLFM